MKITPFRINAVNTYQNSAKKTTTQPSANPVGDQVELSPQALEANKYRAELKKLPAIREEKVQVLKEQVAQGTYRPCASKTAAGIIQDRYLDKLI